MTDARTLACVLAAAVGCVDPSTQVCSSGLVCPADRVCDLQGETCVDPRGLLVAQGEVNLGVVSCGNNSEETITLSNLGDSPVTFTASSTLDLIEFDPETGTVEPGSSLDVTARVNASEITVPVGKVDGAIAFTTDGNEVITRLASVEVGGASIRLSSGTLDYGISAIETPRAPRILTVHNDGNAPVDLQIGSLAAPFGITDTGPFTIAGGDSVDISVDYTPSLVGSYQDEIPLSFAGALCQSPPLQAVVKGVVSDSPLLVDTATVDYGTVGCADDSDSQNLVITNRLVSAQTLTFSIAGEGADLYEVPGGVGIGAGEDVEISVTRAGIVRPITPGSKPATLTISAQPSGAEIAIDLQTAVKGSYLEVSPQSMNWGTIPPGSVTFEKMFVENIGNDSDTVSFSPDSVTLGNGGSLGPNANDFTLSAGAKSNMSMLGVSGTTPVPERIYGFDVDGPKNCNDVDAIQVYVGVGE